MIFHFGKLIPLGKFIPQAAGNVDALAISDTPGNSAGGCGRTGSGFLSCSWRCAGSPQIPFMQRKGKSQGGRSVPQRVYEEPETKPSFSKKGFIL